VNILELTDVTAVYGKVEALRRVSLAVPEGKVTCLLGANGAGKTTLMRAVAGLAQVTSGSIRFRGDEISNGKVENLFHRGIVYQPETRELFPSMTIQENLEAGVGRRDDSSRNRLELVRHAFPLLVERPNQIVAYLSGGEQQMVAIARAFMANPQLLLLDEPSLGLAPAMIRSTFEQIQFLQQQSSLTVLLAEQNTRVSLAIADDVYVLSNGAMVTHSKASELTEQQVAHAYFGLNIEKGKLL